MEVKQGNLYWLKLKDDIQHPYVVLQEDIFNNSRIETVIVAGLTTNAKKAEMPGNVVLEIGEGNLEKQSIVEVTDLWTVNKSQLTEFIGAIPQSRIEEIFRGMKFVEKSFFRKDK